jgi:hypothetical protein
MGQHRHPSDGYVSQLATALAVHNHLAAAALGVLELASIWSWLIM